MAGEWRFVGPVLYRYSIKLVTYIPIILMRGKGPLPIFVQHLSLLPGIGRFNFEWVYVSNKIKPDFITKRTAGGLQGTSSSRGILKLTPTFESMESSFCCYLDFSVDMTMYRSNLIYWKGFLDENKPNSILAHYI